MPKPSDFFIGLVDFIALVLPGAILGYFLLLLGGDQPDLGGLLGPLAGNEAAGWAAFLTTAYVLGHVLHHLGGFVDRPVYDWLFQTWRRQKLGWMVWPGYWWPFLKALGRGVERYWTGGRRRFDPVGDPPAGLVRARAVAADHLARVRQATGTDAACPPFDPDKENLFSWATAAVRLADKDAAAELDRAGVDSKFFRSLIFVAPVAVWVIDRKCPPGDTATLLTWLTVILGLFALYRYCDRRLAAAEETYRYYVLLYLAAREKEPKAGAPALAPGAPANAVTIRVEVDGRAT